MRFIDLAHDGGCSQKASATELTGLLKAVAASTGDTALDELHTNLPDVGEIGMNGGITLATVDVLFPMIDDAELFGRIVVNHVLNDIYAALGEPSFGLAILGAPKALAADDPIVVKLLAAAAAGMRNSGAPIIGGHSLGNQESLFLGLSVCGVKSPRQSVVQRLVRPGDAILMTKRLGTSVASLRWKLEQAALADHADVISGMLQSSAAVSKLVAAAGVGYCTDISGFGFVNNLVALLRRASVGAEIRAAEIPIYDSVRPHLGPEAACTRQNLHNMTFSMDCKIDLAGLDKAQEAAWMDAQTAGGLLFICPQERQLTLSAAVQNLGVEIFKLGLVTEGKNLRFHP